MALLSIDCTCMHKLFTVCLSHAIQTFPILVLLRFQHRVCFWGDLPELCYARCQKDLDQSTENTFQKIKTCPDFEETQLLFLRLVPLAVYDCNTFLLCNIYFLPAKSTVSFIFSGHFQINVPWAQRVHTAFERSISLDPQAALLRLNMVKKIWSAISKPTPVCRCCAHYPLLTEPF